MVCRNCGGNTQVINSRPQKRLNQVWRRRKCTTCATIWTTEETIDYSATLMVNRAGVLQPFARDRLFLSLHNTVKHRPTAVADAAALTDTIIQKILAANPSACLTADDIARTAQVALNRFDQTSSMHYAAFHAASRHN